MSIKNTILSTYEDKSRQMIAIKRNDSSSVDIIHRTLFPTKSNKFSTFSINALQLDTIVNNNLAKPYTINLDKENLIVTDSSLQFIIDASGSELDSKSIFSCFEIPNTTKIMAFFESVLESLSKYEYIDYYFCNHKNENGDVKLNDEGNNVVKCDICEYTFKLLSKEDIKEVEHAVDKISDTIHTIKVCDPTLTRIDLVNYGNMLKDLDRLPDVLLEALERIDNI